MQNCEDHIAYFISDLHLISSRPELSAAFFNLLPEISKDATDLFILGDFFNFWAGDDLSSPLTIKISEELSKLANNGIQIYFQHGNRDFAVGEKYAAACHMTIIPDVYQLPFAPEIIVLHGDTLCVQDVKYQKYRRIIRNPFVLGCLRSLPKSLRYKIAMRLREASKKSHQKLRDSRTYNIDVSDKAVEELLSQHSASTMIHGHTHKPNTHQHHNGVRWVLSDWEETGDYLKWSKQNGLQRHTFNIPDIE